MFTLFRSTTAGALISAAIVVGLDLPGAPTEPIFWLPFLIAFSCFGSTLYRINGRAFGRIDSGVLWELVRELPIRARILLGAVFVATLAQMIVGQTGVHSDAGFQREYASISLWICCCAAGLAYGYQRRTARTASLPTARWSPKTFVGLFAVVGLAGAIALFVIDRNPIDDEVSVHQHLTAAYATSTWYPHLVAVNTYHGAYAVYLDTRDPDIQAAVCTDLATEAAKLETTPDLYYTRSGHGCFARSCDWSPRPSPWAS